MIIAKGLFEGRGGHDLRGGFSIERHGDAHWLVTSEDFYFDGSPEPGFAHSNSLTPTQSDAVATRFLDLPGSGSLTGQQIEVTGKQQGLIGPSFDPFEARSIFLWCFKTPFLLGIGQINAVVKQV